MNDAKNIFLAWASATWAVAAAIETRTLITIISAIVLPVLFFIAGKAIDVWLQIYFKRRSDGSGDDRK